MQLKQKVDREFLYHSSPTEKVATGGHITDLLTANEATFPALPFPVATLRSTNTEYLTLIEAAKEGSHSAIAARNAQSKLWVQQYKATADYVDHLANGDAVIITKAGMTPTKAESTPTQAPEQPINAHARPIATPGSIEADVRANKNVDAYLYIALPEGLTYETASDGMLIITAGTQKIYVKCDTHASTLMAGLESHKAFNVLVQPVNNAGAGPLTDPMQVTPQ
jgi:hypothetical protein